MLYDSTGRNVMAMKWEAIADIPDRVNEIAALVDPNELRYVGWNDVSNELELLLFAAVDIPYDPAASGLVATNVQDAIDEVVAAGGGGGGMAFGGTVDAAAAAENVPAGWSVSRPLTGRYDITHNLGHTDYCIVTMEDNIATPFRCEGGTTNKGINSVRVNFWSTTDSLFCNLDWQFVLVDFS